MDGTVQLLYRFHDDVRAATRDGDRITLSVADWKDLSFTAESPDSAAAILKLHGDGLTLAALDRIAPGGAIRHYLERFSRARLLAWRVVDAAGELLRAESRTAGYLPATGAAPPGARFVLDRFAWLRRDAGGAVLESAAVRASARPGCRGIAALAPLLAGDGSDDGLAQALWRLGFCAQAEGAEPPPRQTWSFHDLLMHEASRENRDDQAMGATCRFEGRFPAPPACKPPMPGQRLVLPPVDSQAVAAGSAPLHDLQGLRRSIRNYAAGPLPLEALGSFLWRSVRVTGRVDDPGQDPAQMPLLRPYPAGGLLHELEFYLAAERCAGLAGCLYHYDGQDHALIALPGSERAAARIVSRASAAMGLAEAAARPQAVVVIASRLPRLAWKYEGTAYRTSLMHAGVVMELMYLVAADMALAPCAVGSGDSRPFEEATGIDRFEETAIAEFALGVPAEQDQGWRP